MKMLAITSLAVAHGVMTRGEALDMLTGSPSFVPSHGRGKGKKTQNRNKAKAARKARRSGR